MESEQLLTQKRKARFYEDECLENSSYKEDDYFRNIDFILSNYNLSELESRQCKLLSAGYSLKEIATIFKQSAITIYKRNSRIKQKILDGYINFG